MMTPPPPPPPPRVHVQACPKGAPRLVHKRGGGGVGGGVVVGAQNYVSTVFSAFSPVISFLFIFLFSFLLFSSSFFLGGSSLTRLFRRQFADVIPLLGAQSCVKKYAGAEMLSFGLSWGESVDHCMSPWICTEHF